MADGEAMQANFGKAKEEAKNTEVSEKLPINEGKTPVQDDVEIDKEYVHKSSVTIALINNYSLYRKANSKVLNKRIAYIGSSVNSTRILSSNKREIETYFPAIIGIASNNENFITRVRQYLSNIRVQVDELGKTFDTSFHYNTKRDYYKIKDEIDKIEAEYNRVDKRDEVSLKKALYQKCLRLNEIESTKCSVGYPINVEDYLMYRHCLLYNDVCKEMSLINSDVNYRFYFKDDNKEKDRINKHRLAVNKAKANYIKAIEDNKLFNDVFIQYCSLMGYPVIQYLAKDEIDKQNMLDKFSSEEPEKFNKIFTNKNLELVSTIEILIARGELIRLPNSQNITTSDGTFIGANMGEVVAWFNDPANSSYVNAYYNKLKNI